jgi:hypothetical protein
MQNDSEFFVWPKCWWCGCDAINQGHLLTLRCQGPDPQFAEENLMKQHAIISQRAKANCEKIKAPMRGLAARIKSFFK